MENTRSRQEEKNVNKYRNSSKSVSCLLLVRDCDALLCAHRSHLPRIRKALVRSFLQNSQSQAMATSMGMICVCVRDKWLKVNAQVCDVSLDSSSFQFILIHFSRVSMLCTRLCASV